MDAKFTELEMKIIKIIWAAEAGISINSILERWEDNHIKPGYTTVLKILQIMEKKGYVGHDKNGRNFVYYSKVSREESLTYSIRKLLDNFFNGNEMLLTNSLIANNTFTQQELDQLKRIIREKEVKND